MAATRRTKVWIVLSVLGALLLLVGYKAARYYWYRGYSMGERTGIVRKISVKGPPYCKYLEGEMVLAGNGQAVAQNEVFTFSVDDDSDKNPILMMLRSAEKDGTRVTLHYRQDLGAIYRCTDTEYFVTRVEK